MLFCDQRRLLYIAHKKSTRFLGVQLHGLRNKFAQLQLCGELLTQAES